MADRKISELTNITGANLADDDEFALVDTSADETKAITFGEFKTALDTATGFVRITGDTMTGNLNIGLINQSNRTFFMGSGYSSYFDIGTSLNSTLITSGSANSDTTLKFRVADGGTETTIVNVSKTGIDVTGTLVSDGLTVDGKTTTDELDLNAIAATISDTAVDIFVYDTRKDSDGGAWRKRTQGTSWYNEAASSTRGSRKEFPAVAVIVAESTQLTIYDGDDPDLPMWMVFQSSGSSYASKFLPRSAVALKAVSMVNGLLAVGGNAGSPYHDAFVEISFLRDSAFFRSTSFIGSFNGGVSARNNTSITNTTGSYIVSATINDVAMTVLPNAPIDAATGLPVPTIAVATDGGLSVIRDDGTVVSGGEANSSWYVWRIMFDAENRIWGRHTNQFSPSAQLLSEAPYSSVNDIGVGTLGYQITDQSSTLFGRNTSWPFALGNFTDSVPQGFASTQDSLCIGSSGGFTRIYDEASDRSTSMVAYTTSDYNTGWMNGDIKLATLSDTDDTNVTGSDVAPSSYTAVNSYTVTFTSGVLSLSPDSHSDYGANATITGLTSGDLYVLSYDVTTAVDGSHGLQTTDANGTLDDRNVGGVGSYSRTLVVDNDGELYIMFGRGDQGATSGSVTNVFDNIVLRLAEEDRSVNGNGLQVFGTVTKSAVATGADLVGYSGFSASNHLQQPHNSDLNFGTGDFSYMFWVKGSASANETIIDHSGSSNGVGNPRLRIHGFNASTGIIRVYIADGSVTNLELSSSAAVLNDVWNCVCVVRNSGTVSIYVNGKLDVSNGYAGNLTRTAGQLSVGLDGDNTDPLANGYLALLRISATAPSPEQIKKIYEDEKFLFQENAQATLYGSSDAVTALAYDDSTELLHAGTSAGRSVFQGLRRVDNTTTAVSAAISASNNLVGEQ